MHMYVHTYTCVHCKIVMALLAYPSQRVQMYLYINTNNYSDVQLPIIFDCDFIRTYSNGIILEST